MTSRLGFPLLAYAFAAVMLGTTLPTPIYALYAQGDAFSVLTTTVIFSAYALGVLAALLVVGGWSDAIGRRPVLIAGAVTAIASAAVFLVADNVPLLLVGRLLSACPRGSSPAPRRPPSSNRFPPSAKTKQQSAPPSPMSAGWDWAQSSQDCWCSTPRIHFSCLTPSTSCWPCWPLPPSP